jgi:protein ImuB
VALLEEAVLIEVEPVCVVWGGKACTPWWKRVPDLGARVAWAPTGMAALAFARQKGVDGFSAPLERLLDRLLLESHHRREAPTTDMARGRVLDLGQVRACGAQALGCRFDKALLKPWTRPMVCALKSMGG